MKICPKFTFGIGDRFAHQAVAQLRAFELARLAGADLVPVWNKSNREHLIIGTEPTETRAAADAAVRALDWQHPFFVDADHITLETVNRFIEPSDFFTLDVADSIGNPQDPEKIDAFIDRHPELTGNLRIEGVRAPFEASRNDLARVVSHYSKAIETASILYKDIVARKGTEDFVTEISMDETDRPQTPFELLVILVGIADAGIPIQTIAPKFTGRFNKGIDYIGDISAFAREFDDDLAVIAHAVRTYNLPKTLKLSVHSGSDKFSLYPVIRASLARAGAGLHIKTAGTTWLEELIGLAAAGGDGLALAKDIYAKAWSMRDLLSQPYATVIDIDGAKLPDIPTVANWTSEQFVRALRHDPNDPAFNPHLRQLLHIGFKVAAQLGETYTQALKEHAEIIGENVTRNLYERHMKPLFL